MQPVLPVQILLVDDSPGDVNLIVEALHEARVGNDVHIVGDGEAAMQFLRGEEPYADAPRPDLVLLDLNLPLKDGREVLAELKSDEELSSIPVIVLSNSTDELDVLHSYKLHANSYVTKPVDFGEFIKAVNSLERFWLSIVKLPPR